MKKVFYALLLAMPLSLAPTPLTATENVISSQNATYFTHEWTGNETLKNVYFDISLVPGLEYPNNYTTFKFPGGLGCEIVCKPQKGKQFETDKGILEEIKITVKLSNGTEAKKVYYSIYTETKYKKSGFFTNTITTINDSTSGTLSTGAINLNERAQFLSITGEPTNAVMIFKQL